jgi:chromosome partitioning protein
MRTLAIANQKGGSGKTTTCVNLAAALAEQGRRVLLVDLDPQHSATAWLAIKDPGKGIFRLFADNSSMLDLVQPTGVPGLEVVPSSPWLVGVEKILAGELGAETILRRHLSGLPPGRWEYVLADCPPTLGLLTVNVLSAVRELLVPVEAHIMALGGLAQLLHTVEVIKERLNPDLRITGILACRMNARTRHAQEILERLRSRFGDLVYHTVIRENVRLAECPSFGKPITLYDPRSAGATDYRALAQEVLTQEGSPTP